MMSNTQNAKIEAITEKTQVLGIDVGSEIHYTRAFDYRGIEYSKKSFKFSNTEAGLVAFKAWILDLKEKHEKNKAVSGMELTGHYWFNLGMFLQDNTRIQNRISHWIYIFFPEYKTVYGKQDAKSGILILRVAPLPEDICK